MKLLYPIAAFLLLHWPAANADRQRTDPPANLSEQLAQMAAQHGFRLIAHPEMADAPALPVTGDLAQLVTRLLDPFNHVLIRSPDGKLERVIVLSRKRTLPPVADRIVINTRRRGSHHLVSVTLVGNNGENLQSDLMVDTGSTFVVLPYSKMALLGIAPEELRAREMQTAKGTLAANVGKIPFIRIGSAEIADIEVAFIEDQLLGDNSLLGMNLLSRYQVVLDDENSTLTLILRDL